MRKVIFFDWDNTLAWTRTCRDDLDERLADFTMEFNNIKMCTNLRQDIKDFLEEISQWADLNIFTASPKPYIEDQLEKSGLKPFFKKVLHADDLTHFLDTNKLSPTDQEMMQYSDNMKDQLERTHGTKIKDISKHSDLSEAFLVDNELGYGSKNKKNILVAPYFGESPLSMNKDEEEIFRLIIRATKDCPDIQECLPDLIEETYKRVYNY